MEEKMREAEKTIGNIIDKQSIYYISSIDIVISNQKIQKYNDNLYIMEWRQKMAELSLFIYS